MKKTLFLAAAIALTLGSCNKAAQQEAAATGENKPNTGLRIAYVQLDTLMSQYQLYKDASEVLTRKGTEPWGNASLKIFACSVKTFVCGNECRVTH